MEYKVRIARGSRGDAPEFREYTVSAADNEILSVMNILEKIAREQDPTLAFFDHAACRQAACGKCLIRINGKPRLACKEIAPAEMTLEPVDAARLVRDLLCRP